MNCGMFTSKSILIFINARMFVQKLYSQWPPECRSRKKDVWSRRWTIFSKSSFSPILDFKSENTGTDKIKLDEVNCFKLEDVCSFDPKHKLFLNVHNFIFVFEINISKFYFFIKLFLNFMTMKIIMKDKMGRTIF